MRACKTPAPKLSVPLNHFSTPENIEPEIHVPRDYRHETALSEPRLPFYRVSARVTDKNFEKVTHKLVPGSWFRLQIFYPKIPLVFDDCYALIEEQGSMLAGAQGLLMARTMRPEIFRNDYKYHSLDQRTALYEDEKGNVFAPTVSCDHRNLCSFELTNVNRKFLPHDGILVFKG